MKWLKDGQRKSFIFHEIIPALFPFGENSIGYTYVPLYSVCLNLIHEKTK